MVVGDTASDMQAGLRAGAGYCVGVLTGNDEPRDCWSPAPTTSSTSVVDLLGFDSLSLRTTVDVVSNRSQRIRATVTFVAP